MRFDLQQLHLLVGDFPLQLIDTIIKRGVNLKSRSGFRVRDQVHDYFVARQRLPFPVDTDKREQAVFDLVPFTGTRGKVTHGCFKPRLIGEELQFLLPQPQPISVRSSRVCGDEDLFCFWVAMVSEVFPQSSNTRDRKLSGVVVDAVILQSGALGLAKAEPTELRASTTTRTKTNKRAIFFFISNSPLRY